MASKEAHRKRSRKSANNSKAGMQYMDWNSQLKTQRRQKMKDAVTAQ